MKTILSIIISCLWTLSLNAQCAIKELKATPTGCNVNGEFFVTIDFKHTGTTNQFTVKGNGKDYGKYTYDKLPLKIGPLKADCITEYEFVVRDAVNTDCFAFQDLGKKCCDDKCNISFENFENSTCKDGAKFTIAFNVKNLTAEASDGFLVYSDGKLLDTFPYGMRTRIENIASTPFETFQTFVICDVTNPSCCDTMTIVNPCVCSIYDVQSQVIDCSEENENFDIRFTFKHNMVSDSFIIGGNNQTYGRFAYKDLPIRINNLPFMSNEPYEFLILDKADAFCFTSYILGKVEDCDQFDCEINDLIAKRGKCVGDSVYVDISFKANNPSLEGFRISGNGINYGNFKYGQEVYSIGPFKQDCGRRIQLLVKDLTMNECSDETDFKEGLCCDCAIEELEITEVCDGDKLIAFDVDFHGYNTSEEFNLTVNNVLIGKFSFEDLPLKITNVSGLGKTIAIKIWDAENEACFLKKEYTFSCSTGNEPCIFDGLTFKALECNDDDHFRVLLKFVPVNAGDKGFIIKVNGVFYDSLKYNANNTYEIGPFKGDCTTKYSFFIQDKAKPDCSKEFKFSEPICCESCLLSNPSITYTQCIDGKYNIIVNFSHVNTTVKFKIKVGSKIFGPISYNDLPYTITGLEGGVTYEILIQDGEKPDCKLGFIIPAINCSTSTQDDINQRWQVSTEQDQVLIQVSDAIGDGYISIYDLNGRQVQNPTSLTRPQSISTSGWPAGIYMVVLTHKAGKSTKKIVKF
jgi:hypothetical protein